MCDEMYRMDSIKYDKCDFICVNVNVVSYLTTAEQPELVTLIQQTVLVRDIPNCKCCLQIALPLPNSPLHHTYIDTLPRLIAVPIRCSDISRYNTYCRKQIIFNDDE